MSKIVGGKECFVLQVYQYMKKSLQLEKRRYQNWQVNRIEHIGYFFLQQSFNDNFVGGGGRVVIKCYKQILHIFVFIYVLARLHFCFFLTDSCEKVNTPEL